MGKGQVMVVSYFKIFLGIMFLFIIQKVIRGYYFLLILRIIRGVINYRFKIYQRVEDIKKFK